MFNQLKSRTGRMKAYRIGAVLLGAAFTLSMLVSAGRSNAEGTSVPHGQSLADRLLAAHNRERARLGEVPLAWNGRLAREAQDWAEHLSSTNTFGHMSGSASGMGENLWRGTAGSYTPEDMVGAFIAERDNFRPGTFPRVAASGSWRSIGHYTQVIWPNTRQVGCAIAHGQDADVMVCRYWPAGNVVGQAVP